MAKVLITGGAGFIGYHLAKKLIDRGDTVHILDNFYRGVKDPDLETLSASKNLKILEKDLGTTPNTEEYPADYDYIYHLAAIIGVSRVLKEPYLVLTKNFHLLENAILLAKAQKNLKRFVFFSTSEIYAGTLETGSLEIPTPETSPLTCMDLKQPRTSYMLSKIYGEAVCAQAGIPYTVVRPHNFYGPRMGLSHVIPELLKKSYTSPKGSQVDVFSVDHTRTFCFISDAVEMIVRLAESTKTQGEAYNIGNESPEVKIGLLAQTVLKVVDRQQEIKGAAATAGSPSRRCPKMAKTYQATDFTSRVSLEEGIKATFDWYRKNIFDGAGLSSL